MTPIPTIVITIALALIGALCSVISWFSARILKEVSDSQKRLIVRVDALETGYAYLQGQHDALRGRSKIKMMEEA